MKNFSIATVFLSAVFAAGAQTNMDTDMGAARTMSLQDCIQQALQHNLDVQIERYNPQISLYDLDAAYGGYDPTFSASGQHNYDVSGSVYQNGFE
ncbi:MAG TPA: TolC family protein, partial [Candidatus Baltobacteraceae bacterium]|nr:TolC family protein [Candidatus Baltobacteraceae bacterium]